MKYHNFTFQSAIASSSTDFNINWGVVLDPHKKYTVRVSSLQMAYPSSGIDNSFHSNLHISNLGFTNSYLVRQSDEGTNMPSTDVVSPLRIELIEGSTTDAVYQIDGNAKRMTLVGLPNNQITIKFLKGNGTAIPSANLGSFSINLEFEEC